MTFPHRIAGLDLSLTGTGIATFAAGDLTVRTVGGTVSSNTRNLVEATHRRLQTIMTSIAALRCDVAVIEGLFVGGSGTTSLQLAELHGLVKHWLWLRGIPYVLVHNTGVKTYAVGKGSGKGTDKDAVLLAVERRYGAYVTVADNNQADALVLALLALEHYGAPLVEVPETHRRALAKVAGWPALEGGER